MADYILIRDTGGGEGHGPPLLSMTEDSARLFLLSHRESYDAGLVVYRVPTEYELRKDPQAIAYKVTIEHLCA